MKYPEQLAPNAAQGRAIAQGHEINRLLSECERLQKIIYGLERAVTEKNRELRGLRRDSNRRLGGKSA
jgi:hypothetical protein